jgi:hypothetical protein
MADLDFVMQALWCSSDGCPEQFFNHKSSFQDKYVADAYNRAMETVRRYLSLTTNYTRDEQHLLVNDEEISYFVSTIQEFYPSARHVITLFSCKHGKILFQRSVRFEDIGQEEKPALGQLIRQSFPEKIEEIVGRPIESYFFNP